MAYQPRGQERSRQEQVADSGIDSRCGSGCGTSRRRVADTGGRGSSRCSRRRSNRSNRFPWRREADDGRHRLRQPCDERPRVSLITCPRRRRYRVPLRRRRVGATPVRDEEGGACGAQPATRAPAAAGTREISRSAGARRREGWCRRRSSRIPGWALAAVAAVVPPDCAVQHPVGSEVKRYADPDRRGARIHQHPREVVELPLERGAR